MVNYDNALHSKENLYTQLFFTENVYMFFEFEIFLTIDNEDIFD